MSKELLKTLSILLITLFTAISCNQGVRKQNKLSKYERYREEGYAWVFFWIEVYKDGHKIYWHRNQQQINARPMVDLWIDGPHGERYLVRPEPSGLFQLYLREGFYKIVGIHALSLKRMPVIQWIPLTQKVEFSIPRRERFIYAGRWKLYLSKRTIQKSIFSDCFQKDRTLIQSRLRKTRFKDASIYNGIKNESYSCEQEQSFWHSPQSNLDFTASSPKFY